MYIFIIIVGRRCILHIYTESIKVSALNMVEVHKIIKLDRIHTNLDYLNIILPSDPDWQLSTYKKLVEKQRDMSRQGKE